MIQNIAKGRLSKILERSLFAEPGRYHGWQKTVKETMKEADPELQILAFKRFTLRAE